MKPGWSTKRRKSRLHKTHRKMGQRYKKSHVQESKAGSSVVKYMNRIIELDEGWNFMKTAIQKLKRIMEGDHEPPFSSEDYMVLYTTIYYMCTQRRPHDYSQQLYDKYRETFEDYISSTVLPSLREKHDGFMLRELVKRWANHKVMIRWLSRFFHYLDRYFVRRPQPTLREVGLMCFSEPVYGETKGKAKDAVIALIDQEREGEQIDRALLKDVLDTCVEINKGEMDFYADDFETPILTESAIYYSKKASNWIVEDSCPDYMLKAEDCLRKEKERVAHYLHASSEAKLLENVQNELLVAYSSQLLEKEHSGFCTLLKDDKVDDLSRMYRLFSRIPKGLDPMATMFKQHVTAEGKALVQQAEDAASTKAKNVGGPQEQMFVRKVIELHDKYMAYVTDCFMNDALFDKALRQAFEVFCIQNVAGCSIAELLALFCDNILKRGGMKKSSDEFFEKTMVKVVKLLAYINDNIGFAGFYRNKLSQRLLFDKGVNYKQERLILSKLKEQCGAQLTSNMEGMMEDLTLTMVNYTQFNDFLSDKPYRKRGIDFNTTVLTTSFWPSYEISDLILPAEMVNCVEAFKEFYKTKYKSRNLTWIYSLGTCDVMGKFDQKNVTLILGTYQATALLLFNDSDTLSYLDIKKRLNLADEDVVRILQSLSCAKYNVLIKKPNTGTVSNTDDFRFNSNFTCRMKIIRIPLPPVDERKNVVDNAHKDWRYTIDAAIVRIMKFRKVLSYKQLAEECVEQLRKLFKPDSKTIKKRVEELITRDFLERDKKNPDQLNYVS